METESHGSTQTEEPGYQALCSGSLPATVGTARVLNPRCNEGPSIAGALVVER